MAPVPQNAPSAAKMARASAAGMHLDADADLLTHLQVAGAALYEEYGVPLLEQAGPLIQQVNAAVGHHIDGAWEAVHPHWNTGYAAMQTYYQAVYAAAEPHVHTAVATAEPHVAAASAVAAPYRKIASEYMANFDGNATVEWAREHTEIPVFCVAAYLILVFIIPKMMATRSAFRLRWLFTLWNLALSVFSILGTYYVVPVFLKRLVVHGYRSTICDDPTSWHLNDTAGFWVALFIFSKIPELFDTAFLVFQKKPVIFLHWYHHTTVMLYCWHAYVCLIPPGIWFAAMNYSVHGIMYTYYFLMSLSSFTRRLVKPFAMLVTMLQLSQMVVGIVVTVSVTVYHYGERSCIVTPSNNKMALAMYGSYFFLFAQLFKKLYISPKGGRGKRPNPASRVCNAAEDGVGATCGFEGVDGASVTAGRRAGPQLAVEEKNPRLSKSKGKR